MDPRVPLLSLLQHIHTYAFTTKANLTRDHADVVAEASSRGFITTEVVPGSAFYGRLWKITPRGLYHLVSGAHLIQAQELAAYLAHQEQGI